MLQTADLLDLPRYLRLILAQPKNEIMVHFPVRLDDGGYRLFKGYRVQHNNILGPYKGGMRYHPDVSLDHVKALVGAHDHEVLPRRACPSVAARAVCRSTRGPCPRAN